MNDELIGKRVGGYEVVESIGKGGMATVYRALQLSMNGRAVALKMLPRQYLNDDTYMQRFMREVQIVSSLEHRGIVPVYDYGETDGQPYIVMRLMTGGSVDDLIGAGSPLPPDRILHLLEQIAPALDYAHQKGVLHRDLKPSNVLMDESGGAYLTDFGIARILTEGGTITTQGVVGTPAYMSPEQAQGKPLDGRSDLYSLGVMLFELATGKRPFDADTPYGIAVHQVMTPPPQPRLFNNALPSAVEGVILRALSKRPQDRHDSAGAMADALRNAIAHPSAEAQPDAGLPYGHDTQPGLSRHQLAALASAEGVLPGLSQPPILGDTAPSSVPRLVRSPIVEAVGVPSPYAPPAQQSAQPPAPYTPAPPIPTPPPMTGSGLYPPVAAKGRKSLRQTARRAPNLFLSAALGGGIGCVLLITLLAVGLLALFLITRGSLDNGEGNATESPISRSEAGEPDATQEAGQTTRETNGNTTGRTPARSETDPPERDTSAAAQDVTRAAADSPTDDPVALIPLDREIGQTEQIIFSAEREDTGFDLYQLQVNILPDGAGVEAAGETRLTFAPGDEASPTLSPDGRTVAFLHDGDGDFDLYTLDMLTGDVLQLTDNPYPDHAPAWSASGEWIAFSSSIVGDGSQDIYRVRPDGSDLEQLVSDGLRNTDPTWSTDAFYLLYTSGDPDDRTSWDIRRLTLRTQRIDLFTRDTRRDSSPAFMPDGGFVYSTDVDGNGYGTLARVAGSESAGALLYDSSGYDSDPFPSPDGCFLVFTSDMGGQDDLYVLLLGDNRPVVRRLTFDGAADGQWGVLPNAP